MDKRLLKRHKRQVLRAKERVRVSEPDLRTPEQIDLAREASRPAGGWNGAAHAWDFAPRVRNRARLTTGSTAKVDA